MSGLLARRTAHASRRVLRGQTAWYNGATDRLALEIRLASQARHEATLEREQILKERQEQENQQEKMEENNETPILVQRPNRGELLSYRAQEAPSSEQTEESLPPDNLEKYTLLPRKKLRALVSLYHQSSTFITPETLDQHIEKEFALDPRRPVHLDQVTLKKEVVWKNLNPEMTTNGLHSLLNAGVSSMTMERKSRAKRVNQALWGVDEDDNPDLEAVEEAIERRTGPEAIENRRGI
ncbi:hypothetical protein CPB86DRAFT_710936 [Serendipita vermifera]|nr:hypothetical protein CPB86DRAFT_710936 [Serendipita vermifera]